MPEALSRWLIMKAPRIPKIDPKAAPSRRFKLALSRRISKKTKKSPRIKPKPADSMFDRPKGRRWNAETVRIMTKMTRTAPISHDMRPHLLLEPDRQSRHHATAPFAAKYRRSIAPP